MSEYIDKSKLYGKLAELECLARQRCLDTPSTSPCCERYYAQLSERTALKQLVADFPTEKVAEVAQAEWAHLGGDEWCCTHCGYVINTEGSWENPRRKYCEECGAKMPEVPDEN